MDAHRTPRLPPAPRKARFRALTHAWIRSLAPSLVSILFNLVFVVLDLFKWALILAVLFNLLTAFGVLDTRNRLVWTIGDFLERVTEPVLRPIRSVLPNFGNVDLSPLVALILLRVVIIPLLFQLEFAIIGPVAPVGF